jgi:hypothetical protein
MPRLDVCALFAVLLLAADNPLAGDKFLQKADEKFEQAMTRAQESYAKVAGDALDARLKVYRSSLASATKTGDFDRATAIKDRVAELEAEREELTAAPRGNKKKAKIPEDAVEVGGHKFALIKDPAPWHVAKHRCEDLGGRLAITRTPEALETALKACRAGGVKLAWLGATDEVAEGKWLWVDGTEATITGSAVDNYDTAEHYVTVSVDVAGYGDSFGGMRLAYICEWDD